MIGSLCYVFFETRAANANFSLGAVANTVILPSVPPAMHWPTPELFRRKKSATVVKGGCADHITAIGAVVPSENFPVAVNWTSPFGKLFASAVAGATEMETSTCDAS